MASIPLPASHKYDAIKCGGQHYTPPALAKFLAVGLLDACEFQVSGVLDVLDPACGEGELLLSLWQNAPNAVSSRFHLHGFDTDEDALAVARARLCAQDAPFKSCHADFLGLPFARPSDQGLLDFKSTLAPTTPAQFDLVIANPPYVRTQVLGGAKAQSLARDFELSGRVDLFHAFVKAIGYSLKEGGALGLLTSNRFLYTRAGAAMREILTQDFEIDQLFDFGDTKLFKAAVLPAVVIARKKSRSTPQNRPAEFVKIYEKRGADTALAAPVFGSIFEALEQSHTGLANVDGVKFEIERGDLAAPGDPKTPWQLAPRGQTSWAQGVNHRAHCFFGDVARVKVGIKTTADAVFIRKNWMDLPATVRPERELVRPLLTHHVAARFSRSEDVATQVLYPYREGEGKRHPIALEEFPGAKAYLESHAARLRGRKYVMDSGRQWFEIWVPHHLSDFAQPKLVTPDISEGGRFFLDRSGAIVNGDCYWLTLRAHQSEDWLLLMLGVANSSFALDYYDAVFTNKLYAGRRRFITQYVERFPLPALDAPQSREIVALCRRLTETPPNLEEQKTLEKRIDDLVWEVFGGRAKN